MKSTISKDSLSICLLGEVGVEPPAGHAVPALQRKGWAILCYLISESGVVHSRERLSQLFWPSLAKKSARNNLRQAVFNIQRMMGDMHSDTPYLITDRHSISINPDNRHCVDLYDFLRDSPECPTKSDQPHGDHCITSIEAKVALYRGEFMAGFHLEGCLEFEDWLQINREALLRRALIFLERLSHCYKNSKAYNKALFFAQRATQLEPWNEEGLRQVMGLLAQTDQQGAALSQYDAYCRALKQELGAFPEEPTRRLAKHIKSGEFQINCQIKQAPPLASLLSIATEKRQVTVLYCQLSIGEAGDPEESFDSLRKYQLQCIEIVQHFSGHVVWTHDGGLLVYFGYPDAREHAAQRAVSTALLLIENNAPQLQLRIGVHTGLIIASNNPDAPDIIGKTSGIAIGLHKMADSGTVIVSATTQRLVSGYFEWAQLESTALQNNTEPAEVFRAIQDSGITSRLEAAASLTPLTGRQHELSILLEQWGMTCENQNFQVLLLRGDPGIGKSRLVHSLKQEVSNSGGTVIELQNFPEFNQTPFHPFIELLRSQLQLTTEESPELQFNKLLNCLEKFYSKSKLNEIVPLFANLLSLPLPPSYQATASPLNAQRQQMMDAILNQLYTQAARAPVLFVIEDLHWCDPSTLELLSLLLANQQERPIFALFTTRPEFQSSWAKSQLPCVNIKPLSDDDIHAMIKSLGADISLETSQHIVKNADGIPLFAEELVREIPIINAKQSSPIPASLHDLLAARLDGMGEAKNTVLLAATLGRKFSMALLRKLSLLDEPAFQRSIDQLEESGLISQINDVEFQFRHALFQDAACQSQTRSDRQAAHKLIADTLETSFPEVVQTQPEVMAQHLTDAGETETAIEYWIKAGKRSSHRCAHNEAISQLNSGLTLLKNFPDGQKKDQLEFEIQLGLGVANYAIEGYASPAGMAAYSRALALGDQQENNLGLFDALWGVWASSSSQTNYPRAQEYSQRLLEISLRGNDPVEQQEGHYAVGNILYWRGEFTEARKHLEQAIKLYRPEHNQQLISRFGENAYVTSCSYLSWILCLQGLPEQAMKMSRQAIAEARRIEHPFSLGFALTLATVLARKLKQPSKVLSIADETIQLAEQYNFPLWNIVSTLDLGWALVKEGQPEGIEKIRQSNQSLQAVMSGILLIALESLADALCHLKQFDEALAVIMEAKNVMTTLGDHHAEAEIHRLEGECMVGLSNNEQAETCFNRALEISRTQQARLFELRATKSLAKLWQEKGRAEEARRLLETTYKPFTEGHDTPDLQQAQHLLKELQAP